MSKPGGVSRAVEVEPSIDKAGSGFSRRGEGSGDTERSEKVVVGDSVPDLCDEDFQPKKLPSRPPGDFGLCSRANLGSEAKESSESVRLTPSYCKVILGACGMCIDVRSLAFSGDV